jgi:hypothetical protein
MDGQTGDNRRHKRWGINSQTDLQKFHRFTLPAILNVRNGFVVERNETKEVCRSESIGDVHS